MKYLTIFACLLFLLIGFISYASEDTLHLIAAQSINVTFPDEISNKLDLSGKMSSYRVLFYDSEERERPSNVESNQAVDQLMKKYMNDAKMSSRLNEKGPDVPDSAIMSIITCIECEHSPEDLKLEIFCTPGHYNHFTANMKFISLLERTFIEIMKASETRAPQYIFTSQCKRAQEKAQRKINAEN